MSLSPSEHRHRLHGFALANHRLGEFHPPRVFVKLALSASVSEYPDSHEFRMEFLDGALCGYGGAILLDPPNLCEGFDPLHQDAWLAGYDFGEQEWDEEHEWKRLPTYDEFQAGLADELSDIFADED